MKILELPKFGLSATNVSFSWMHKILSAVVMISVTALATRHFGLEKMGLWILVVQFTHYIQLLELGITTSINRLLPRYLIRNDYIEASRFVSTAFYTLVMLGLFITLMIPGFSWAFPHIFNISPSESNEIYWLVALSLFVVAICLPARLGFGLLGSLHRFDIFFKLDILGLILRGSFVMIALWLFNPNLLTYGLLIFAPQIFSNIAQLVEGLRRTKVVKLRLALVALNSFKKLISLSLSSLVITLASALIIQGGSIAVGAFMSSDKVPIIAFPIIIATNLLSFTATGAAFISPIASQLSDKNLDVKLSNIYVKAASYSFSLALLIAAIILFAGPEILSIWLGKEILNEENLKQMSMVLFLVVFGETIAIPGFIGKGVLVAIGKHWVAAWSELLGATIGIVVGLVLMNGTSLGIIGMGIGISIGFLMRGFIFLQISLFRSLNISFISSMAKIYLAPTVIGFSAISIGWVTNISLSFMDGNIFWISPFIIFIIWAAGNFMFVISEQHKNEILFIFQRCFILNK